MRCRRDRRAPRYASLVFLGVVDFARKPVAEQAGLRERLDAAVVRAIAPLDPADRIVADAPRASRSPSSACRPRPCSGAARCDASRAARAASRSRSGSASTTARSGSAPTSAGSPASSATAWSTGADGRGILRARPHSRLARRSAMRSSRRIRSALPACGLPAPDRPELAEHELYSFEGPPGAATPGAATTGTSAFAQAESPRRRRLAAACCSSAERASPACSPPASSRASRGAPRRRQSARPWSSWRSCRGARS